MLRAERFGAVGDDGRDDRAALQRAIDAAAQRDAGVQLGDRTYHLSGSLRLPSGTYLRGSGDGSELKFDWDRNDDSHDGYYLGNEDQLDGNSDITLENFAVTGAWHGRPAGPKATQPAPLVPGIRLRLVDGFRIEGLRVSHVPGISVLYQGCANGVIHGNVVRESGRDGITGTWRGGLHDISVTDNTITKTGDDAIAIIGAGNETASTHRPPTRIEVRGNTIKGWRHDRTGRALGRGVVVLAGRHMRIADNTISNTASYGILVAGATNGAIDPNTSEPWQSRHITVAENAVERAGRANGEENAAGAKPGTAGIAVLNSAHIHVRRNDVSMPAGSRIVYRNCTDCGR